jgi:hypothetical protein
MASPEHLALCREVLAAVRGVADKRGHHVELTGDAVKQLTSACARSALAIAQAGDPTVKGVACGKDDDGEIFVTILHAGDRVSEVDV